MTYTYTGQVARVKKKHEKWNTTYYGNPVVVSVIPRAVIISEQDDDNPEAQVVITGIPMDVIEYFEIVDNKQEEKQDEN